MTDGPSDLGHLHPSVHAAALHDDQERLQVVRADVADADAVADALRAAPTSLLWLESPTNPLLDVAHGAGVAGLIATNTTLTRDGIARHDLPLAAEAGGLSGAPLTRRAREVVSFLSRRSQLPVIGVGGIMNADDGRALIDAGAELLQVYSGFIYRGPGLVRDLNEALRSH